MQGQGSSHDARQPWYVTRIPTLPDEEMLPDAAASEGPVWGLYQQLKLELCAVLRRVQATRDGCRVLEEVLAKEPELPMIKYLDDKIQEYMAVESAFDEGDRARLSARGDELVQETTENTANVGDELVQEATENTAHLVQNGY
ncbi:hypothetical protein RHMOL_Rhmol11G0085700 [Rhododendron molle]|uniref:Uncharacterized protein n=1 Tax=Rhododendron molle TaxID=49168 RepID=A0ACC0LQZ0_RHOML|nr:hypothetical protein RHMOL_Rhmol11G0085700 [Rhododendron molle]